MEQTNFDTQRTRSNKYSQLYRTAYMVIFVELQVIGKPVGVYFRVIRYLVYVLVVKIEKK